MSNIVVNVPTDGLRRLLDDAPVSQGNDHVRAMAFLLAAGVVLYDHHQLNRDEAPWSSRDLAPKVRYVGCTLLVIGLMLAVIGL